MEEIKKIQKTDWTTRELESLGFELLDWIKKKDNFLVVEFFSEKDILEEWVESWYNKKDQNTSRQFKLCYKLALQIQKSKLIKMLSSKLYSSSGVAMIMKNLLGWNDSVNVESKITDLSAENLDKIIKQRFPKYKQNFDNEKRDEKRVTGVNEKGELIAKESYQS